MTISCAAHVQIRNIVSLRGMQMKEIALESDTTYRIVQRLLRFLFITINSSSDCGPLRIHLTIYSSCTSHTKKRCFKLEKAMVFVEAETVRMNLAEKRNSSVIDLTKRGCK